MSYEPREQDTIYTSLRDRIKGKIPGLTNFTDTSFNWVWTQGFSSEFREKELDKTATYLSGLVDYAGGPIEEEDLRELGIEDVASVSELNERLDDADLDELVKIVGISRDPGTEATGTVTFSTQSAATTIPAGTSVGLQPDTDGSFLEFTTDEQVSTGSGTTTVQADITATEVGTEYNVGSGTITYLPNPPNGVQSAVNNASTSGGENEETNDELRERAKNAIFETSGGGTVQGIIGFIESEVAGVSEVTVEEFFTGDSWHGNYPHGHVIVDGGSDDEVLDAIASSRPVSVEHILVRPDVYNIAVDTDVSGQSVDDAEVKDRVETYLNELGLGDEVVYNKIIQQILNADDDITDVEDLDLAVQNEILYLNEEEIDNFENNDITILNRNWNGWSGDTGSFSAQSGTALTGTYSGELSSSNSSVSVTATKDSGSTTRSFEAQVRLDSQTGDSSDAVTLSFESSGTALGAVEFRGDGNVVFSGNSDTTVTTWTAGTTYTVTLQWNFDTDTVEITVNGATSTGLDLSNSVSNWTDLSLSNDTTSSTNTVNAYIDEVDIIETTYSLGLGDEMVTNGITEVTGISNGSSITFVEDDDYHEAALGGSDDAIQWILSGARPDINDGNTSVITYDSNQSEYRIDDAMVDEGINKVEDASGTVYTEGTDYEEVDLSNDNRDDGIEWLGNSEPADGAEVTVTYSSATASQVDYDISDVDILLGEDEKADAGVVTVTVL
jgi:uncharacterized phage protein gp47/JayE